MKNKHHTSKCNICNDEKNFEVTSGCFTGKTRECTCKTTGIISPEQVLSMPRCLWNLD